MPIDLFVRGRIYINQSYFLYWIPFKNRKIKTKNCTLVLLSDILILFESFKDKTKNHLQNYLISVMAKGFYEVSTEISDLPQSSFFFHFAFQ